MKLSERDCLKLQKSFFLQSESHSGKLSDDFE